jgi:hypothetical protein
MSLPPIPNTKLLEDPTGDAIWKRWLNISFKNVNAVSSALYVSSAAFHVSTDFATSSQWSTLSSAAFRVSSFFATSSQWSTLSSAAFHVSTDFATYASLSSAAFHVSTDFSVSSHSHAGTTGFLQCVYTNEDYTVSSNISAITGVDLKLVGTSKFTISGTGRLTIARAR